jgi:hypothetical protein
MRSRHYGLSIWTAVQYLHALPPVARTNSDFIITGQMNRMGLDLLAQEFSTIEKQEFIKLVKKATADYNFLIINNNSVKDQEDLNTTYGCVRTPKEFL